MSWWRVGNGANIQAPEGLSLGLEDDKGNEVTAVLLGAGGEEVVRDSHICLVRLGKRGT